ncbi:MAG: class I SAM-dependent methyltransferase [Candidatus Paceibacterota bacterium]
MDYKDYTIQNNSENYFWHKARKKLIDNMLGSVFQNYDNNRLIFEIGCGTGYQMPVLEKYGKAEGLDINPNAVKVAIKNRLNVKVGDAEDSDFGSNKFEAACLFDALEHIKNDSHVVKKIYSCLKNNGFLFLTVPSYNFMFSEHDRAMGHFRRYNKRELLSMLKNNGFEVIKSGYWNFLLFPAVLAMRLFKNFLRLFIKEKINKPESSNPHPLLNNLFYKGLMLENFLIKKNISFPFGVSLFVVARKP